jgi:hypothetical protein
MRLFSARYAVLVRNGDRRRIQDETAAIKRCLSRKLLLNL